MTTGSGTGVGEAGMTAATTVTMTQAVEALGPSVFEMEVGLELKLAKLA